MSCCGACLPKRPPPRRQPHRRARRLRTPAAVPAFRRRRPAPLRRPDRRRRGSDVVRVDPASRCGTCRLSSAIRSASSTTSRSSKPTTPSSCWRCSTRGRRRRSRRCSSASSRAFARRRRTRAILEALLTTLIDERHARFNDTLYQLEPDVKDAPGALRDLLGGAHHRAADRSGAARRGPADRARLDDAEDFLLRVRSILHLERKRNQNVLSHELQEQAATAAGLRRRAARSSASSA